MLFRADGSGAEGSAGGMTDDDDAGDAGTRTPVWPPANASLAQLEEWLDALRRLPEDDVILGRQALLGRRIEELRRPLPAQPAEPLTLVLRAKRVTDKRRRQLRRFSGLLDELLAQEVALRAALLDAHATVDTTRRLLALAEEDEYRRFQEYAASLSAPGRTGSPTAAEEASADSARHSGGDAAAAQGVCGLISQLLMLPAAAEASNLGDAHAALLQQARLIHEGLTGNPGPTLVPDQSGPGGAPGGRSVPPRMSWVPGTGPDPPGMPMPQPAASVPAAGLRSASGPPVEHGGYAGPGSRGHAPTPAEAADHVARARSATRSVSRARSATAASATSSRSAERERSPRGVSAIAAALAAAVAEPRLTPMMPMMMMPASLMSTPSAPMTTCRLLTLELFCPTLMPGLVRPRCTRSGLSALPPGGPSAPWTSCA